MGIKSKMQNDKHGVSTLLIVVAVIVIVVIIAVAAIVLSDNSCNSGHGGSSEDTRYMAPGTMMTFDTYFYGAYVGTVTDVIVGQNSESYFCKAVASKDGSELSNQYGLFWPLSSAKITGTEVLDTIDGKKTLMTMEHYSNSGIFSLMTRYYVDPDTNLIYKSEDFNDLSAASADSQGVTEQILKAHNLVLGPSYTESDVIGKTYVYDSGAQSLYQARIVFVADCLNGQYGMECRLNLDHMYPSAYYISDGISGLPADAVDTGNRTTLTGTIDGNVSVEIWKGTLDMPFVGTVGLTFYYEPNTHIIYRIILTTANNNESMTFNLRQ